MNHIFKVVWNESIQAWQAVSELSGSAQKKGKSQKKRRALRQTALTLMVLFMGMPAMAELPIGGLVRQGSANIQTNGTTMTIMQSTARLVTDWQSFSVGAGKTVEFVQPSSSAAALNRVTGADVSTIQGAIRANGQVFLLNPNGVLFTPTAQVNVGGLVASTLDMVNEDFMAGRLRLTGNSTASVVNQGQILTAEGGTVALVAARIVNSGAGQITADKGQVLMGAGSDITLDLGGAVKVRVDQGALNALIQQGAAVQADGGLVYFTAKAAGDLTATVINHSGTTRARTLATGESGNIYLMGGMAKDRIQVGGRLDASAPTGGNGGFVETSAARVDVAEGLRVDTRATSGLTGNWLIDPNDYRVQSSGGNITGAELGAQLNTSNVTIQTVSQGSSGSGDIFVQDAIAKSAGSNSNTTLTLLAERNISITKSISGASGSPLNMVFSARATGGATGSVEVVGGLPAGVSNSSSAQPYATVLRTYGGNITIGGGDASASGFAVRDTSLDTFANPKYQAGVRIYNGAVIDASSDGGATLSVSNVNNWQGNRFFTYASAGSTSGAGGDITIRGKGDTTAVTYNWGVQIQNGSLATAGAGKVSIEGEGGNGGSAATSGDTNSWSVGSVGVLLERSANLLASDGNITVTGRAGTGYDRYGVASTESNKQIKTAGYLKIDGDSLLIRDGTLTLNVSRDSDIQTPIVGCAVGDVGCGAYTLTKLGAGLLNLWGDAQAWNAARPANTRATANTGIFNDAANKVNLVLPGADLGTLNAATEGAKKLFAFGTLPPNLELAMLNASSASPLLVYYIRPIAGSSVYGDAPNPSWGVYYDSMAGSVVTNVGTQGTANWSGVLPTTGVGSYALSYGGGLTSTTPGAFLLAGTAASWEVTRRPVSVAMTGGQNKLWGQADPAQLTTNFSAQATVNNDVLVLTNAVSRAPGELPGRYALTANQQSLNANNPNYALSLSIENPYLYVQTMLLNENNLNFVKRWGEQDPTLADVPMQFAASGEGFRFMKLSDFPGLVSTGFVRSPGEKIGLYAIDRIATQNLLMAANPGLFRSVGILGSNSLRIDPLPGLLPGLVSRVFPLDLPKSNLALSSLIVLRELVKVASTGVKHSVKKLTQPSLKLQLKLKRAPA